MTAHDTLYGRRGGGWVEGDPTAWRDEFAAIRAANGGTLHTMTEGCDSEPTDEQLNLFGETS